MADLMLLPDGFFDIPARTLVRDGKAVRLPPPACRLLVELGEARGHAVSTSDLAAAMSLGPPSVGRVEIWASELRRVLSGEQGPSLRHVADGWTLRPPLRRVHDADAIRVAVLVALPGVDDDTFTVLADAASAASRVGVEVLASGPVLVALAHSELDPLLRVVRDARGSSVAAAIVGVHTGTPVVPATLDIAVERARLFALHFPDQVSMTPRAAHGHEGSLREVEVPDEDGLPCRIFLSGGDRTLLPAAPPSRLPARGGLVGHRSSCDAALGAIDGGVSLLVLSGPPGIGKTAVAVELAHRLLVSGRRRVRHVALEGAGGVTLAARVGDALDLRIDTDPRAAVARAVRQLSPGLVVLDGLDALPFDDVASTLTRWREVAPGVAFVGTSRRPLRLPGAMQITLGSLTPEAAGALLQDVSRGIPGWDAPDPECVRDIVASVSRHPRLLRVLAGLRLPPALLRTRLRRLPAPLQDLTQGVELAREALRPGARRALARLAALRGPFDGDDLATVLLGHAGNPVDAAVSLVQAGLARVHTGPAWGSVRITLPGAVREAVGVPRATAVQRRLRKARQRRAAGWVADHPERPFHAAAALARIRPIVHDLLAMDPDETVEHGLVRALALTWEVGMIGPARLLQALDGVGEGAPTRLDLALLRGLLGERAGTLEHGRASLEPLVADPVHPHMHLGTILLDPSPVRLVRTAGKALRGADVAWIDVGPHLIERLMEHGLYADAEALSEHLAGRARQAHAWWRAAVLDQLAWRARAAVGRARAGDDERIAGALAVLHQAGDHRRVTAGLLLVARARVHGGDVHEGLALLRRALPYIGTHGTWVVRHQALRDLARARALTGDHEGASAAYVHFRTLSTVPPAYPRRVILLEGAALAGMAGDLDAFQAYWEALPPLASMPGNLQPLVRVFGTVPDAAAGRVAAVEQALDRLDTHRPELHRAAELVRAWARREGIDDARSALEADPVVRGVTLTAAGLQSLIATVAVARAGRARSPVPC